MARRRHIHSTLRLGAALLASFAVSIALAAPLTLAEAQRRAVERSAQISGQGAAIQAARDMAVAAGHRPDPQLKLGLDNMPVTGPDRFTVGNDFMTMMRIGVMQEFTRGDKLARRSERFEREAQKGEAERDAFVAAVQRDTALAWLDCYYGEAVASAIAEQREQSLREVEAADAYYRGGRGSQADAFAARAAVVALEDRLSEARRRIATARVALARWLGADAEGTLAGAPAFDRLPEHLVGEHLSLDEHPEVRAAGEAQRVAEAEVRIAEDNRDTDWSWEVSYARRGSAFSDMVSVGVSVPLPWDRGNKQDREVAAKRALVVQAAAQREETLRMHTAEVKTMVAEWRNGLERHARLTRELVPLAEQRTAAALAAYRGGKGTLPELLAARRAELEARSQVLQLDLETARTWARLAFLVPAYRADGDAK